VLPEGDFDTVIRSKEEFVRMLEVEFPKYETSMKDVNKRPFFLKMVKLVLHVD
jgi:hypothetical protein